MHQCGQSDFTSQRMPAACSVRITAHSLTHSLSHTHTHSLTPSPTHTLTHSLLRPLTHSHTPSFTHSHTHSLLHLPTHTHSPTYSLFHTHPLTHSLTYLLPPAETLLNFFQLCYRNGSVAEMLGKTSLWDDEATGAEPVTHSGRNTCITVPYMAHGGDLG